MNEWMNIKRTNEWEEANKNYKIKLTTEKYEKKMTKADDGKEPWSVV